VLHVWLIVCLFVPVATPDADAPTQDSALFLELQHELNIGFALENLVQDNAYKRQIDDEEALERATKATSDWMECRFGDRRRCSRK